MWSPYSRPEPGVENEREESYKLSRARTFSYPVVDMAAYYPPPSAHHPYYEPTPPPPGATPAVARPLHQQYLPSQPQLVAYAPPLYPQSSHDEVRTLFIAGLPEDVKAREIYNLFREFPGYESSHLRTNASTQVFFKFYLIIRICFSFEICLFWLIEMVYYARFKFVYFSSWLFLSLYLKLIDHFPCSYVADSNKNYKHS